jgi:hypothetical protein
MTRNAYLFPHSPQEFPSIHALQKFLLCELPGRRRGAYHLAHADSYEPILPGSRVLFHKNKKFYGHGTAKRAVKPYTGTLTSPVTGRRYEGTLTFDPDTIRLFEQPIPFRDAEKRAGITFNWQHVQPIPADAYDAITRAG